MPGVLPQGADGEGSDASKVESSSMTDPLAPTGKELGLGNRDRKNASFLSAKCSSAVS